MKGRLGLPAAALAALQLAACRRDAPAPPPPGPGPDARDVAVESRPAGAEVLVRGAPRCRTPCTFRLDPGRYRLVLRLHGYMPWEEELWVKEGSNERVEASLVASH